MKRFEGKVALITGGNSGIGLASAERLHRQGARVRSPAAMPRHSTLRSAHWAAMHWLYRQMSRKPRHRSALLHRHLQAWQVDVLFANAGVGKFAPYAASQEALFDELFAINVKGVYFTLQKAIPHLNDGASVVLNTSIAASKGAENMGIYAATKAAVRSFARTAAAELQARNIRVNAVAPGPYRLRPFSSAAA